uniref:Uncharacterized protein n=1 Tax=Panagrolaimus sp. ES5 TaxID=591445 RepID=A0AC34F264_9BILA
MQFPSVLACGLGSVQFKNTTTNRNQLQTALYLRKASSSCSPTIKISDIVDEYVKAPTTTTSTTTSTAPMTTTTIASTTPFNVRNWIHTYWWSPILGALILITLTLFLCVVSCICQNRSSARVNKLYRRVLIRRHERKKETEKLKKEEKQEIKPITEEAFLADTVNIIDEVMLKPDSSALNEPEKIEPKKIENDVSVNVTSVIPPWKVPWKSEQQNEEDGVGGGGGNLNENIGVPGTISAIEGKSYDKKEELSDEDWLQLDNHTVYNSAKESEMKKLSKESSVYCEVNTTTAAAPAAEEHAVDLENLP